MRQSYGLYLSPRRDRIEVLDYTKSAVLYSAQLQRHKPQLSVFFHSPLSIYHDLIGLANFRRFSTSVDLHLRDGQNFNLRCRRFFPVKIDAVKTFGYTWIWTENWNRDLTLVDKTTGSLLATFYGDAMPGKRLGQIVLLKSYPPSMRDAIIVMAFAKLGYKRLARSLAVMKPR